MLLVPMGKAARLGKHTESHSDDVELTSQL